MILPSGKPNILITGGAGFIGSHLADALVKENNVIVIDNFSTGSEKNIDHILQNPNFEFIRHDLTQPFKFEDYPELRKFKAELQGVQEVYHLACPASPKDYVNDPIATLLASSHATFNALEIAKQYKAKFLFLSSSSVYGNFEQSHPVREGDWGVLNPIDTRSCYAEGKRFAENLILNYQQKLGLNTKIARVFNTYGPRMRIDDGRMIPEFIVTALTNQTLTIYGDENSVGSYCYVSDMVDALIKLMASDTNQPVNLGSIHEVFLTNIANLIIQLTNSSSTIEFKPTPNHYINQLIPDISLAKETIDWFPIMALEDGLNETIEHMKVSMGEYKR